MKKKVEDSIKNIISELSAEYEESLIINKNPRYPCPSFQSFVNSNIVSKALASYLQTSGCCVVLGRSQVFVNQVLHALSLFCSKQRSNPSKGTSQILKSNFKAVFIHAASTDTNKECDLLLEKAYNESLSLTVVDTDLNKVWQTISPQGPNNMNSRYLPANVNDSGLLIPQFLNDLAFIQQNDGDSELFIENFHAYLLSKSTSFIKIIDGCRQCYETLEEKEIMILCGVQNSADLQIFLACAERLKPGFRTSYTSSF